MSTCKSKWKRWNKSFSLWKRGCQCIWTLTKAGCVGFRIKQCNKISSGLFALCLISKQHFCHNYLQSTSTILAFMQSAKIRSYQAPWLNQLVVLQITKSSQGPVLHLFQVSSGEKLLATDLMTHLLFAKWDLDWTKRLFLAVMSQLWMN